MTSRSSARSEEGFPGELSALLHGLHLRGLRVGTDDAARVAAVFRHADHWPRERRVRALESLLARSDDERQVIRQLTPLLFVDAKTDNDSPVEPSEAPDSWEALPSRAGERRAPRESQDHEPPPGGRHRRALALATVLVLVGALALALPSFTPVLEPIETWPASVPLPDPPIAEAPPVEPPRASTNPCPVEELPASVPMVPPWVWTVVRLAAAGALLWPLLSWRRQRSFEHRRETNLRGLAQSKGPRSFRFDLDRPTHPLDAEAVREAAFQLNAPSAWTQAPWLDPGRTVEATARRAGRLALRFGVHKEHRPLLLIEDVSASMARWPDQGRQLGSALERQGSHVVHRFMRGEPTELSSFRTMAEPSLLPEVLAGLDDPRVVVLSDASGLRRHTSAGWLGSLRKATWLHPRQPEHWHDEARWLSEQLEVVPLDDEGLLRLGAPSRSQSVHRWRPPQGLAETEEEQVAVLRAMLTPAAFRWLCAGAVFCKAGRPSVRMWRGLLDEAVVEVPGGEVDRVWETPGLRVSADGTVQLDDGLAAALVERLARDEPDALAAVVRWGEQQLDEKLGRNPDPSGATIEGRSIAARLLALDPRRLGEGRQKLQSLVDEGFGSWLTRGRQSSEPGHWKISWRRPRESARKASVAAGLLLFVSSIGLQGWLDHLDANRLESPKIVALDQPADAEVWTLTIDQPLRLCDVYQQRETVEVRYGSYGPWVTLRRLPEEAQIVWELSRADLDELTFGRRLLQVPVTMLVPLGRLEARYPEIEPRTPVSLAILFLAPTLESQRSAPDLPQHCEMARDRLGIEWVFIPGGSYTLGTDEELDAYRPEDRHWPQPAHRVALSPFWIAKHPVTNAQYQRFLEGSSVARPPEYWTEERFNAPQQPVVGVSWLEAMAFAEWAGVSLPSEAQWEAAARGYDARTYPWGNEEPTPRLADFVEDVLTDGPDRVGSHPAGASPFGVEDMAGSVWEWCLDEFDEHAYQGRGGALDPVRRPQDGTGNSSTDRVLRGGSWAFEARVLPSAIRGGFRADSRDLSIGFRVVCGSAPEP